MSLFDDDDDGIFTSSQTVKSKYASLFDDDDEPPKANTTSILNNLSVKSTNEVTKQTTPQKETTQTKSQSKYPTILYSGKVEVYKESESSAEYTTVGIAIAENKSQTTHFQLILYYTKENYLVNVPISNNFVLTNQMKDDRYFGTFYDHKNKPWIFRYVSEDDVDNLLLYISFAKHIETDRKRPTVQDIYTPTKGTIINESFKVGIQCATYHEENGKLNFIDNKNHVTTIGNPNNKKGWDECLEGMKKFGRRAVAVTLGNKVIIYKINVVKLAPLKKDTTTRNEASPVHETLNLRDETRPSEVQEENKQVFQPEKIEESQVQSNVVQVSEDKDNSFTSYETVIEQQTKEPSPQIIEKHSPEPNLTQTSDFEIQEENISSPNQTLSPQQVSSSHQNPQSPYNTQQPLSQQPIQQQYIPPQQQTLNIHQPHGTNYTNNHSQYQNQPITNTHYSNESHQHYHQQPNSNPYNYVSPVHTNNSNGSLSLTYYNNDSNNQYMNQNNQYMNQNNQYMNQNNQYMNQNNQYQHQNVPFQQHENSQYQNQNTWNQPYSYNNQQYNSPYQTQQNAPQSRPEKQKEIPITSETIQLIVEERQLKSEIKESLTKIYDKLDEVSRKLDNSVFAKDIKTVGISAKTLLQCIQRIVYENESMLSELEARNREKFGLNFD